MSPRLFRILPTLLFTLGVGAAEIQLNGLDTSCDRLRGEVACFELLLSGEIVAGDANKLKTVVQEAEASLVAKGVNARVSLVILDSPGGDILEGMAVGRVLRSRQISTMVTIDSVCASACVLILAGGVKRIPAGRVIVHSFYSPALLGTNDFANAEKRFSAIEEKVRVYLKEMRVSNALLEEMMRVPHFTSRDLTLEQMTQWGVLGIDPVYAQTRKTQ